MKNEVEKKVPPKTCKNGEQIFRPIARFKKRPYLCTVKRKRTRPRAVVYSLKFKVLQA
jgi:hypothetical protein